MNTRFDLHISHESAIPLHSQLYERLRDLVADGSITPGQRLPSEAELCRQLNISRNTVRQALQRLEGDGLIARVPGRGTYVTGDVALPTRQQTIAFITGKFDSDYYSALLAGAEAAASERGYHMLFSNVGGVGGERAALDLMARDGVRGALIWPMADDHNPPRLVHYARESTLPLVAVDRTFDGLACDLVTSRNYEGAYSLMEHLIALGHRHIVFLSHRALSLGPVADRLRAYRDALRAYDLPVYEPWLIGTTLTEEFTGDQARAIYFSEAHRSPELERIVQHYQNTRPRPTAIFGVNDYIAMIGLRAASLLHLRVPVDLSIAGFDNIDVSAYLEVPLTTVAQDIYTIGSRAAHLLLDRIAEPDAPTRIEYVATQLKRRASTAPVGAAAPSHLKGGDAQERDASRRFYPPC
jgi:DNA-binding LacI/PurR family transcriptional regulator